jgi:hypothetical protein
MTVEEKDLVAAADGMSKEIFAKHFTHRHLDSLASLTHLPGNLSDESIAAYRAFHRQLHRTRVDLNHDHNG